MCLGVPGKVIEVDGLTAMVDFWGARRRILLAALDEPVAPGDYVLTHVGYAICRIPSSEIAETLAFYDALVSKEGRDLMANDITGEIAAAGD